MILIALCRSLHLSSIFPRVSEQWLAANVIDCSKFFKLRFSCSDTLGNMLDRCKLLVPRLDRRITG